jgi:cytoskeletal protein RodZ
MLETTIRIAIVVFIVIVVIGVFWWSTRIPRDRNAEDRSEADDGPGIAGSGKWMPPYDQ